MAAGLELTPIPADQRRATRLDVALIFAGANIVTTTLVTGGSLAPAFSVRQALTLVAVGGALGTLLIAGLSRLGPRLGLPTMMVLRWPFGARGAAAISVLLILTNFAWIALNNVIAGSAIARLIPGPAWGWNLAVGSIAVAVTWIGPRAMALFDRFAVPLLALVGAALTVALFGAAGRAALAQPGTGATSWLAGFDLVVGYQVSWSLMFADYTRYQRRECDAVGAVFCGLFFSSVWLMAVGAGAGTIGGGNDPTAMILGLGLPGSALLLMALSTITTNFVNLYLSSLALKTLWRAAPDRLTVLAIGAVGTGIGLLSRDLLDSYAAFMGLLGSLLLPIVAVVAVHFFTPAAAASGAPPRRWNGPGLLAWGLGALCYQLWTRWRPDLGATLPTLVLTALAYWTLRRWWYSVEPPPSGS